MGQINFKKTAAAEIDTPKVGKVALFVNENNEVRLKKSNGEESGVVPVAPKFDFLLVAEWHGVEGTFTPDILLEGMVSILTDIAIDPLAPYISKYSEIDEEFIPIAGGRTLNPYVPISQTTIFVHPETFERYRFNGTTMEVYDDVDGVVPKWLKYEALLTRSGTNAPLARVLNQDERDYLGTTKWTRNEAGKYNCINPNLKKSFCKIDIDSFRDLAGDFTCIIMFYAGVDVDGIAYLFTGAYPSDQINSTNSDVDLYSFPISIKQRLRGAPPKLLSVETNTVGDKIILSFDKKMSSYFLDDLPNTGISSFIISNTYTGDVPALISSEENKIILYRENGEVIILKGDEVLISKGNLNVESFDYGLLQPFENFPVTNNVVENE